MMGSLIAGAIIQIFISSSSLSSELYRHQSISFIHDVFEDDLTPPLMVHSTDADFLVVTNSLNDVIEYSLNRGRIGRRYNGSRRDFISPDHMMSSFVSNLDNGLLRITLHTLKGDDIELLYATQ